MVLIDGEQSVQPETADERRVWDALQGVKDPEIPLISLVELGIISEVSIIDGRVSVKMLPTFAGCHSFSVELCLYLVSPRRQALT